MPVLARCRNWRMRWTWRQQSKMLLKSISSYPGISLCCELLPCHHSVKRLNRTNRMHQAMKIDGSCHCGAIRYEAQIDPDKVVLCHCTDCQAMSGAPYRVNVPVLMEKLDIRGEPRRYIKIGSSGARIATTFCGTCGAPVYSCAADDPKFVYLRLGGVTQRAQLSPKRQGFCASSLPWAYDIRSIPKA
jgi:hypothetical protein